MSDRGWIAGTERALVSGMSTKAKGDNDMTTTTAIYLDITATLHDGLVDIDREGEWLGRGTWNGRQIEDCTADLGDAVYAALDGALIAALGDAMGES